MITIFKTLYGSKDVPYHVTMEKVIDRIKNGSSAATIQAISDAEDKETKQKLKLTLPCILFAGNFSERNSNSLIKHSGLCVLDFDGIPLDEIESFKEVLKQNEHITLIFKSPRGNGLKAVIKIPEANKESHKKYFKGFENRFNYDYFDSACSNIDRVCFESYDPDLYYNPNAKVFECNIENDEGYQMTEKVPLLPIDSEEEIVNRLMKWWDAKYGFVAGERNRNIYVLACAFCEYGVSQDYAIGYINNNIVIGDFPEKEAITAIRSAYKKMTFGTKYFENEQKINKIKGSFKDLKKNEIINKFGIDDSTYTEIKEEVDHDFFWYYTEEKKPKLKIDSLLFKNFLERHGYKKFFPHESNNPTLVFIESNKVEETSSDKIKDFVLEYLLSKRENEVWNYCSTSSKLFSDDYLTMLSTIELMMLKDEKDKSYIAFRNGILEVTADKIELKDYIDIEGYIWKNQIINREFKRTLNYENDYKSFINNICKDKAIESVIGYLLSTYKDNTNNKAIILNDEVISENPEGGTGKGLFIQGIKQIRKVAILDGKTFDDKKSFPYQTVQQDTQILVFDDVVKNFNFESKFSLVTEGMTLERKNKDAIKLTVKESPKMVISTNYAIKGEGNSHDRRRFEIEFAQHYGKKNTPFDEFKRQIFDDWTVNDFTHFDNYMVFCLQSYLRDGLMQQDAKNIKLRKFIAETSMEFYEWINDSENFRSNTRNNKGKAYETFVNEYIDYKKLSRKRFHIWVEKYSNYKGFIFSEGNTQGERWFMVTDVNTLEDAPF